jgi:23S rRNA (guanosine2251-2'-O)-methyltransferase
MPLIELIVIQSGHGEQLDRILQRAAEAGVPVKSVTRVELDRMLPGARHQGVAARCDLPRPATLGDLLHNVRTGPLLLLDGVEDPHNLGAVIRSAEALGGSGVVFRRRRAAGLTPAAVKASAGAAFRLPVAEVPNLHQAIRELKKADYWVFGLDAAGEIPLWEMDMEGRLAFVLGSEGSGLSRLVRESCDGLVRIPLQGETASLNVSVSAALALGEWGRKKMKDKG